MVLYLSVADIANPEICLCVDGPGFGSTAPTFMRSSASHPAGPLGAGGFDTICTTTCRNRYDSSTTCRLCHLEPLPYGCLLHPRPALTNYKSCRTATGCTQTYICMMKHSHFPYTSTHNSTPHNTHKKHTINHIPYTHTLTLQGNTIFNNSRYTTNIPTQSLGI